MGGLLAWHESLPRPGVQAWLPGAARALGWGMAWGKETGRMWEMEDGAWPAPGVHPAKVAIAGVALRAPPTLSPGCTFTFHPLPFSLSETCIFFSPLPLCSSSSPLIDQSPQLWPTRRPRIALTVLLENLWPGKRGSRWRSLPPHPPPSPPVSSSQLKPI